MPYLWIQKIANLLIHIGCYLTLLKKSVALSNVSICYTWENIKSLYRNYKFKVAPTWNDKFELPDGSFSVSDIQDHFDYIIKKHETFADNPPIKIYINKIETE